MKQSVFRLVSIGRATENLKRNQHFLNVEEIENRSGTDGEQNFDPKVTADSYTNAEGETIQTEAIVAREVECQWLPTDDNRLTPPDIRRGELVEIWRQGDSDKYYWRSLGLRNDLRSLESVIYAWGATPDLAGHQMDLTKCYIMSVSAHDKHFTISTSKANGESYSYNIQINTKESAVYITDDDNNFFELDSKDKRLQLKNSDGSYVKVERRFIELKADEYIDFKVMDNNFRMTPNETNLDTPILIKFVSNSMVEIKSRIIKLIAPAIQFLKG